MWTRDERCKEVIEKAWDPFSGGSEFQIQDRIKSCQFQLQKWNWEVYGNVSKNLKNKQHRLQQLEALNMLHETAGEIKELRKEINEVLNREELMWTQRSRALWMKCGVRNTQFFHATVTQRQRNNKIEGLWDSSGWWCEDQGKVEEIILEYFSSIYSTEQAEFQEPNLEAMTRILTEMNALLLEEFKAEEVRTALWQMHPTKSPGPDGMSPIFFQKYWSTVGPSVTKCVLHALNTGVMPSSINETYICLIPKLKCPQRITDFRPISLCNVLYKIISKVLANRLKKILPEVIDEAQSAFVPGRQITDNVLVTFETMHCIKRKRKGKKGMMAIKLDMSKAYDRVEWRYLEAIMRRMGFQERWIALSMMCVKTVSYSVLINGIPKGCINPTRGLHQGDPISPYLFLLCAEGLSAMIKREMSFGSLNGGQVCRGAPQISHLLFADDSIIFCRASMEESNQVIKILTDYERDSGQKLNGDKTSLFFSKNTLREVQDGVKDLFGA